MKACKCNIPILFFFVFLAHTVVAKGNWPREIDLKSGAIITIYQPQPEKLDGNKLFSRAVVSVRKSAKEEPVFGVFWSEASLLTDKDTRTASLESIKITNVKFPDVSDSSKINEFRKLLESEIPKWNIVVSLDELVATIEQEQGTKSDDFNTDPPEIYYRSEPATLVLIDGEPIVKQDDDLKMERVLNTPFLIVKNPSDKTYYLYAGSIWYNSQAIKSGWKVTGTLPSSIKSLDSEIKKKEKESQAGNGGDKQTESDNPRAILVSTVPAELIQSDGEAQYASIKGTGLLYVTNSQDYIFKNIEDQQHYILLSGRWYESSVLEGPWTYVASDKLPADFANIPEGSDMDEVLSSVAGTDAAREAVIDAQIPQTAKVDRKTATCSVSYDGEPKFEKIEGTDLYVAVNCSGSVMRSGNKYYAVEEGIWFVSDKATGPWNPSEERPEEINKVPPSSEVYNTRYVYIYDVTPDYIYMGYTPGYLNCYVYGPTVIYGTGFYYRPWYGTVYYPRPVTWGFGMHYNPWYGWSMSFSVSYGFFSFRVGGYPGGWWGPPVYRPPYYAPYYHRGHGGYYGPRPGHYPEYHGGNNNIYRGRNDVATRDINRSPSTGTGSGRPSASTRPANANKPAAITRPAAATRDVTPQQQTKAAKNNVYSDKSGNVYRRESSGDWQKRSNGNWQSTTRDNPSTKQLDRSSQMRNRSDMRVNQSAPTRSAAPRSSYGGASRNIGGGGMRGGRR